MRPKSYECFLTLSWYDIASRSRLCEGELLIMFTLLMSEQATLAAISLGISPKAMDANQNNHNLQGHSSLAYYLYMYRMTFDSLCV